MHDPGPRPTNAEMAQVVAMLQERCLIEVYPTARVARRTGSPRKASVWATCSRWSRASTRTSAGGSPELLGEATLLREAVVLDQLRERTSHPGNRPRSTTHEREWTP